MTKFSRAFLILPLLALLPSCILLGVGKPASIEKDLPPETLNFYRALESTSQDPGDLGGTFFTLFPLVFSVESISPMVRDPKTKESQGYVGASVGLHLLGLVVYSTSSTLFSPEGKIQGQVSNRRLLTGLIFHDWSYSRKDAKPGSVAEVEGWSVLWGFFGREVRDGKTDWTFLWFL